MSLALWHWHIEVSSKCTLRCPRCARSEVPDSLVNTELDLKFFEKNFTHEFVTKHVEKITFCGDDGDPIYAHDFLKIIRYLKNIKPISIVIVTNGSYKPTEFWLELSSLLDENDQIHFSIDGYDQASNEKYRINSDFQSIIEGAKTIIHNSKCYTIWDAIAFKFNEDMIEVMKAMAKNFGFDCFQLTKSTKFAKIYSNYGPNDVLQPSDNFLSSSHRFEREITKLSTKSLQEPWLKTNLKHYFFVEEIEEKIKPVCHIGNKGLFINSKGEFYPCCWVANRYSHNKLWNELGKKFNLHKNVLHDVVQDKFWNTDYMSDNFECRTKCDSQVVTKNYATEW